MSNWIHHSSNTLQRLIKNHLPAKRSEAKVVNTLTRYTLHPLRVAALSNTAVKAVPFGRWTLRDKPTQRRLAR